MRQVRRVFKHLYYFVSFQLKTVNLDNFALTCHIFHTATHSTRQKPVDVQAKIGEYLENRMLGLFWQNISTFVSTHSVAVSRLFWPKTIAHIDTHLKNAHWHLVPETLWEIRPLITCLPPRHTLSQTFTIGGVDMSDIYVTTHSSRILHWQEGWGGVSGLGPTVDAWDHKHAIAYLPLHAYDKALLLAVAEPLALLLSQWLTYCDKWKQWFQKEKHVATDRGQG